MHAFSSADFSILVTAIVDTSSGVNSTEIQENMYKSLSQLAQFLAVDIVRFGT